MTTLLCVFDHLEPFLRGEWMLADNAAELADYVANGASDSDLELELTSRRRSGTGSESFVHELSTTCPRAALVAPCKCSYGPSPLRRTE